MRLITFVRQGQQTLGAWIEGDAKVVDIARAAQAAGAPNAAFSSMLSLIEAGPLALDAARKLAAAPPQEAVYVSSECRILAPLPRPTQIRDCLTFPAHLEGSARMQAEKMIAASPDPASARAEIEASGRLKVAPSFYEFPLYYISNRMTISGPDDEVVWPPYSQWIDYEMEWAVVIGKECAGLTKENAREAIFGYTIFNDWLRLLSSLFFTTKREIPYRN